MVAAVKSRDSPNELYIYIYFFLLFFLSAVSRTEATTEEASSRESKLWHCECALIRKLNGCSCIN